MFYLSGMEIKASLMAVTVDYLMLYLRDRPDIHVGIERKELQAVHIGGPLVHTLVPYARVIAARLLLEA